MICLLLAAVSCMVVSDGPMPAPDATYEQMRANAGRDAEAQVKLALWCEAHGLEKERLRHLAVATLADPSNALARGLLGVVEFNGKWKRPDAVARDLKTDMARADLLAEYNGRRARAQVTVAAQYKLALWCEEKGLKDETRAHLATVVRLDPNHADAWKRLGYKKVGGHWTTDAQSAAQKVEQTAQQEADKRWKSRLEHLRDALAHKGAKHDEAERELAAVTDPRAVSMVWKVFVQGHEKHHLAAVQLLGQIDAAAASRALATLALSGKSDEVRRRALETLRRRDPREYADVLIMALRDKIKYEVKKVGGPGSTGVLFVEGKEANLSRYYSPPPPQITVLPGDTMSRDENGLPVLVHHVYQPVVSPYTNMFGATAGNAFGAALPTQGGAAANQAAAQRLAPGLPPAIGNNTAAIEGLAIAFDPIAQAQLQTGMNTVIYNQTPGMQPRYVEAMTEYQVRVPVGQQMIDAQRVAKSAADQLQRDVASLDATNAQIVASNEKVASILKAATGEVLPAEPIPWRTWFVDQLGFRYKLTTPDPVPTVVQNVSLDYQTAPLPVQVVQGQTIVYYSRHSCFGQGTPVRTISGPRPIESIAVGDLVLSQSTKTGGLSYRPVVMAHHNPPSATFRVSLGDEAIVTSPSHRFWVAGRGWVMARDLKVGDPIRTLGDVAKVTAIESEKVQPVFNLDVADDADFFVGTAGALVHDNTLPDLRLAPFDAPSVAALK
jgi:hypothetical protein